MKFMNKIIKTIIFLLLKKSQILFLIFLHVHGNSLKKNFFFAEKKKKTLTHH